MSRVEDSIALPPDPPVPAPPHQPDFLISVWPAGTELIRCGSDQFPIHRPWASPNRYRFSPVTSPNGLPVPTLYAGDTVRTAYAETVFHDVPVRGEPRSVPFDRLLHRVLGRVIPRRELKLADFTTTGLARLGLTPRELTETGPRSYLRTGAWSQAVYESAEKFDGIVWVSRLNNTGPAVMLFGGRVRLADLDHSHQRDLEPVTSPAALDALLQFAEQLKIEIAGPPWQRH